MTDDQIQKLAVLYEFINQLLVPNKVVSVDQKFILYETAHNELVRCKKELSSEFIKLINNSKVFQEFEKQYILARKELEEASNEYRSTKMVLIT